MQPNIIAIFLLTNFGKIFLTGNVHNISIICKTYGLFYFLLLPF